MDLVYGFRILLACIPVFLLIPASLFIFIALSFLVSLRVEGAFELVEALLALELLEIGEGDLQAVKESGGGPLVDQLVEERLENAVERQLQTGGVFDDGEDKLAAGSRVVEAAVGASAAGGGTALIAIDLGMAAAWGLAGIYQAVNGHGGGPPFG